MTFDLAIEKFIHNIPDAWNSGPFRRYATLVVEVNAGAHAQLLSLSSSGVVSPRTAEGGLGKQAPAEATIERYWLVSPGDLVVNPMWLIGGGIGVSEIHGAVSPDYRVYRLSSSLHPRYVHHLLRSHNYRAQYRLYTRAETTFDRRVSKENFHPMPVPVPPIAEQRRIADFLDAETGRIDELIRIRTAEVALVRERVESVVSDAFVVGGSAHMVRLGYLAQVQSGVTVDASREQVGDVVTRPYLRVANVQAGYVKLDTVSEITVPVKMARASTLRAGDVLMTEGGDLDKLGRGTVWRGQIPDCLHQNHVFAVRPSGRLNSEYLALFTRTAYARRYFESTGTKTTNLASTSSSKIRDLRVPLISQEEQAAVVGTLDVELARASELIAALDSQRALLEEKKRALITAAVTGEFDVSSASGRG